MRRGLAMLLAVVPVLGCGSAQRGNGGDEEEPDLGGEASAEEEPEPEPEPVVVRVRALHAAAASSKKAVTVTSSGGDDSLSVAEKLAFGRASDYVEATLPPDANGIELSLSTGDGEAPFDPAAVRNGAAHTAILYSDPEDGAKVQLALATDRSDAPEEGSRGRLFHAVVGWGDIDLCLPGAKARAPGEPIFTGAVYGRMKGNESSLDLYEDLPEKLIRLGWCGGEECGHAIEDRTERNMIGTPVEDEDFDGVCVVCGKKASSPVYIARAM